MYSLCSWPKDSLYISQDGKPSFALLSTLRLWETPVSKRRTVKHIAYSGHLISVENEVAVMEWTVKKCQEVLSSCWTLMDEDMQLLHIIDKIQDCNGEEVTSSQAIRDEIGSFLAKNSVKSGVKKARLISRWRLAVEWRYRYKRILSDCITHCVKTLDNLSTL